MTKGKGGGFMKSGGAKTGGTYRATPKTKGLIFSPAKPLGGKGSKAR